MADDGSLVLSVPNAASWQALLLADRWNSFDVPRHPFSYDHEALDSLLAVSGLRATRRKKVLLLESATGLATSLFPALDPIVRRVRGVTESKLVATLKSLAYGTTVGAAVPLVLLEAANDASATLMVEARRSLEESGQH